MNSIDYLLGICKVLKKDDILADLELIKSRLKNVNQNIIIPLVGEFSSGKTSIINALTDCKSLETASKATTATIFEIRFGANNIFAEIVDEERNTTKTIEDLGDLKNENLADTKLVRVYDTSNRVPNSMILVDTPGLSSNDYRHRQTLMSYLPYSDAIFLTIDINQQITRSLTDFIELTKLDKKPLFIIVTKSDTKTKSEIKEVKKHIAEHSSIKLDNIICVSAKENDLEELFTLIGHIQNDKNNIVEQALTARIQTIKAELINYIDDLLNNLSSSSSIEESIKQLERQLRRISDNIERLKDDTATKIQEKGEGCISNFRNKVYSKLENIALSPTKDYDRLMLSSINEISSRSLATYRKDIHNILKATAKERQGKDNAVPLQVLESLDLSEIAFSDFSYNLELGKLGHEYDGLIAVGVKAGLVIGAVAASVYLAGPAATAVASSEIKEVVTTANTAKKTIPQWLNKHKKDFEDYTKKVSDINNSFQTADSEIAQVMGYDGGILEQGVSWLTDKAFGKPQRQRAINDYISNSLLPDFNVFMENVRLSLVDTITGLMYAELETTTEQMKVQLEEMQAERISEEEAYNDRIKQLKEFRINLKN